MDTKGKPQDPDGWQHGRTATGVARDVAWGDIRLVEMGARPDKTRPALVLTQTSALPYLSAVTVAPVTDDPRNPDRVVIVASRASRPFGGQPDNLQTVSKERLGRYLGTLPRARWQGSGSRALRQRARAIYWVT